MKKWSIKAWWFFVKRTFPKMIMAGIMVGIVAAIKKGMADDMPTDELIGLLFLGPLAAVSVLATLGTFTFGTFSWLLSSDEAIKTIATDLGFSAVTTDLDKSEIDIDVDV